MGTQILDQGPKNEIVRQLVANIFEHFPHDLVGKNGEAKNF